MALYKYIVNVPNKVSFPLLLGNYCFRLKHQSSRNTCAIEDPIVITDDSSTIVCWHPEKEFPYEMSKSLPVEKKPVSVLKTSEENSYKVFKKESSQFIIEELMQITNTTKHRWFPRSRDKRAKKTPSDREYL